MNRKQPGIPERETGGRVSRDTGASPGVPEPGNLTGAGTPERSENPPPAGKTAARDKSYGRETGDGKKLCHVTQPEDVRIRKTGRKMDPPVRSTAGTFIKSPGGSVSAGNNGAGETAVRRATNAAGDAAKTAGKTAEAAGNAAKEIPGIGEALGPARKVAEAAGSGASTIRSASGIAENRSRDSRETGAQQDGATAMMAADMIRKSMREAAKQSAELAKDVGEAAVKCAASGGTYAVVIVIGAVAALLLLLLLLVFFFLLLFGIASSVPSSG